MKIYVDFDDVLCETARALSALAKEMFGRDVPYEDIKFFNLQKSFSLSDAQIEALMARAHEHDFLLGLEPTPGGVEAVRALCSGEPVARQAAHSAAATTTLGELLPLCFTQSHRETEEHRE